MDAAALKDRARAAGADLVGIADAALFREQPAEGNPLAIFPECRAVVVIGRRILRGSLRGVEEGTNFGSTYRTFGCEVPRGQLPEPDGLRPHLLRRGAGLRGRAAVRLLGGRNAQGHAGGAR